MLCVNTGQVTAQSLAYYYRVEIIADVADSVSPPAHFDRHRGRKSVAREHKIL